MREILFRGKREADNEWILGSLIVWPDGDTQIYRHTHKGMCVMGKSMVQSETVGQYTGLTDKNGKKIFEGDVIRYNTFDDFDCHSVVKFGKYEQDGSAGEYNPKSCIGWYCEVDNFTAPDWADEDPVFFFNDYLKQQNLLEVNDECEIIGNIHDNPELLGGEGDG